MPATVLIDGAEVFITAGSLIVDNKVGKKGTASFVAHTSTSLYFQEHQEVEVYDDNNVLAFSGYIKNPKAQKPGFQSSLNQTIQCVDQTWLAEKRVLARVYTNKTCGAIVQDIADTVLAQEGVTVAQIFDGLQPSPTLYPSKTLYPNGNIGLLPSATFAYCTVTQALDALVKQASSAGIPYYWQIDQNKQLWFVPYTAVTNTTIVDGTTVDDGKRSGTAPVVQRQNPSYRNTQYIVGGVAQTVQQVETRNGSTASPTTTWTMSYALASAPTITVNGVVKSVGVKGTTGYAFYWAQGDAVIAQDSSGTKLVDTDVLQVVYIGQYPTVFVAQNQAQVSYAQSLDRSSGIVEQVEQDNTISSAENGYTSTSQLLTRYSTQGTLFQFSTMDTSFVVGQLRTFNIPSYGLNNMQMLITEVSGADQSDSYNFWYSVTAMAGPYDTTWVDFFSSLLRTAAPANSVSVGVSQTFTQLAEFSVVINPTIAFSVTGGATCPLPSRTLYPSKTLYPC